MVASERGGVTREVVKNDIINLGFPLLWCLVEGEVKRMEVNVVIQCMECLRDGIENKKEIKFEVPEEWDFPYLFMGGFCPNHIQDYLPLGTQSEIVLCKNFGFCEQKIEIELPELERWQVMESWSGVCPECKRRYQKL